jgi:predicted SprT family Zn-dependent metalloprotease
MKPSVEQIISFQSAFDYFNQQLFQESLPPVILNFSRSRASTIAFYAPKQWEREPEEKSEVLDEISLNPAYLGRSMEKIFSSLVHEQCHQWQWTYGKPSRNGYHNKEWVKKMQEVGLEPDNGRGKGTGQKVSHKIIDGGIFQRAFESMPEEYKLPWRVFIEGMSEEPKPKKKGDKVKYRCDSCGANVWGKSGLNISCNDCNVDFEEEDE